MRTVDNDKDHKRQHRRFPSTTTSICSWNKISTCHNKPTTIWRHKMWTLEHYYWTPPTVMAWTSDAFKPRNASQTIFQRSVKTCEEEAWQTPDDMDNYYSTRLIQERHTHKPLWHKRHRKTRVDVPWSRGMESKMQYAGTPRDVTTEFSERAARDVWLFVMMIVVNN